MPGDEDKPTKQPGTSTLMLSAQRVADERAERRRAEERVRDSEQEDRTDRVYGLALQQAEKRAESTEKELKEQKIYVSEESSRRDKRDRFQWAIIAVLVMAVICLAGYRVAGDLMKGQLNLGGPADALESE